jgi:hypothetical protein
MLNEVKHRIESPRFQRIHRSYGEMFHLVHLANGLLWKRRQALLSLSC